MAKFNDNTYFVVQSWMVTKLGLKGVERDVFAIIYGYSQDGESNFHGSLSYLAEMTGYSKNSVCTALKSLTDKGLILKDDKIINNIKFCRYTSNLYGIQDTCTGIQATCTNNNININNNILSKDNIASEETEFSFGEPKTKKPNLYQKCSDLIHEWTNIPSIEQLLFQYLDLCMEMKSIRGANQWKGMLNTLEKVQKECHPHTYEEIIQLSINHGWKTFYPIKDTNKKTFNEFIRPDSSYDNLNHDKSEREF